MSTQILPYVKAIGMNLIIFVLAYYSASLRNYYHKKWTIKIKRFKEICWFKESDKGVLVFNYVIQVYSVIQFIFLLLALAATALYGVIANAETTAFVQEYGPKYSGFSMAFMGAVVAAFAYMHSRKSRKKLKKSNNNNV